MTHTDPPSTPDESIVHSIGPLDGCPSCEGHDFLVTEHDDSSVFQCLQCHTAWRYELGYVWPLTPDSVDSVEPLPD